MATKSGFEIVREIDIKTLTLGVKRLLRYVKGWVAAEDFCKLIEGDNCDWEKFIVENDIPVIQLQIEGATEAESHAEDDSESEVEDDDLVYFRVADADDVIAPKKRWLQKEIGEQKSVGQGKQSAENNSTLRVLDQEGIARACYFSSKPSNVYAFLKDTLEEITGYHKVDFFFHGLDRVIFFRSDPQRGRIPGERLSSLPVGVVIMGLIFKVKEKLPVLLNFLCRTKGSRRRIVKSAAFYEEHIISTPDRLSNATKILRVTRRSGATYTGHLVTIEVSQASLPHGPRRKSTKSTVKRKRLNAEGDVGPATEQAKNIVDPSDDILSGDSSGEELGKEAVQPSISPILYSYLRQSIITASKQAKEVHIIPEFNEHDALCLLYLCFRNASIMSEGPWASPLQDLDPSDCKVVDRAAKGRKPSKASPEALSWRLPSWRSGRRGGSGSSEKLSRFSLTDKNISTSAEYMVHTIELSPKIMDVVKDYVLESCQFDRCFQKGIERAEDLARQHYRIIASDVGKELYPL